jgi:hypothetical protein
LVSKTATFFTLRRGDTLDINGRQVQVKGKSLSRNWYAIRTVCGQLIEVDSDKQFFVKVPDEKTEPQKEPEPKPEKRKRIRLVVSKNFTKTARKIEYCNGCNPSNCKGCEP